ncbi:MAG: SDR family NAD(P)-dependent oxidoreductase [Kofleriaceae bacterium]
MPPSSPTALVTGGASGIGLAIVAGLARARWRVVVASRDPSRGGSPSQAGEPWSVDLSEIRTVRALAARVRRELPPLDAVVACAGVWPARRIVTAAGLELGWAVNHVGHAALVDALGPALAPAARIVVLSSGLHAGARIHWDDPSLARGFDARAAYGQSKLANLMYALALARRQPTWRVNAIHPGVAQTGLHASPPAGAISPAAAAKGPLALLLDPRHAATTGRYFDQLSVRRPAPHALDRASQERLWGMTMAAIGRR